MEGTRRVERVKVEGERVGRSLEGGLSKSVMSVERELQRGGGKGGQEEGWLMEGEGGVVNKGEMVEGEWWDGGKKVKAMLKRVMVVVL